MSAIVDTRHTGTVTHADANAKLIDLAVSLAIGLGVFLSGFVIREPAPYELYMAVLMSVWALLGLRLSRGVMPLLVLLVLFVCGGLIAMLQMSDLYDTPLYLAVTLFLGLTSVFFASVTEHRPQLLQIIFRAWTFAAFLTSIAGVVGYLHLVPGAEMFTRYGRAAGVFEDPNVFGPFLVLPAIWLAYRMLTGQPLEMVRSSIPFLVICAGLFLAFSRGAWGLFVFCSMMLVGILLILNPNNNRFRLRVIILSVVALSVIAVGVVAILQIEQVAELFSSRAHLVQEYDAGRYGRFARFGIGLRTAMENPLGIGALEFGRKWGEDTHNIWLKALLDYSWLGFAAYSMLICWTLAAGLKLLTRRRPWQPFLLCAYVVFCGHILLATVIDIDHWRHFYLLLGIVWGCILLEQRHRSHAGVSG